VLRSSGLINKIAKYNKNVFFITDFFILNFCFLLAKSLTIYFFGNSSEIPNNLYPFIFYSNLIWLLLSRVFGIYSLLRFENASKILSRILKVVIIYITILYLDIFFLRYVKISTIFVINYSILFLIIFFSVRITLVYFLKLLRKRGINNKLVLIVGVNENTIDLSKTFNNELSFGYKLLGFFSKNKYTESKYNDISILGTYEYLYDYCNNNHVDEIFFSTDDFEQVEIKKVVKFCDSKLIRFKLIPNFQKENFFNRKLSIDFYGDTPVLVSRKEPLEKNSNILVKRLFDIIFSLCVILILFPLIFPFVYIIQKLSSQGPVFFIQRRSGQDNHVFKCIKFRTMYVNKESELKGTHKNDPRITSFGKFLRKTRIDELPQFINVFIGNMSVVGPRPLMLKHTEDYSKLIDDFLVRHFVKPGITGWAQTTGFLDEENKMKEMQDKVKRDVWYIENWSFLLDLKIVLKTLTNLFCKDENAF
jgi:putative colanic acid biosynthesis UDP-glucose lipid carrier transferase